MFVCKIATIIEPYVGIMYVLILRVMWARFVFKIATIIEPCVGNFNRVMCALLFKV